jgi:hypothetical protein
MLKMSVFLLLVSAITLTCSDDSGVSGAADGSIQIGVIREAGGSYVFQRLSALANDRALLNSATITDLTYRQIPPDFNPDTLAKFDIIYLAEDWAVTASNVYENIKANKEVLLAYIENGGALYSDQPNAYDRLPNGQITIDFLADSFTVSARYTNEQISIVDPDHYITSGLDSTEMPLAGDQVADLPASYEVLAQGSSTGYPALFVSTYGSGKILFCMGSASNNAIHAFSNQAHLRMISWLVK